MFKSMSKKIVVILMITLLVMMTACAKREQYVRIGTASMGGAFYPMGNALAQLITENVPDIKSSAQSTGGSAENCRLLQNKEVELALIQSATLREAINGEGHFKDNPVKNMKAITALYFMPFHVIVRHDANINKISDIRGKRVSLGPIASGIETNALNLLNAYDITRNDIRPVHQTLEESYEAIKLGNIDVIIYATGVGSAQITDLMRTGDLKIVSLDQQQINRFVNNYPEFGPMTINKDIYPNQPYEINTIAGSAVLVARSDLDEKLVYNITKTIFTNLEFLGNAHAHFKQTKPETATVGIVVPLHPGAEKYLKEAGAIK